MTGGAVARSQVDSADQARSALIVGLRGDLYALCQAGNAVLLPWLQRYRPPSSLPAVPPWIAGLVNVRGTAQVIVDLGLCLGLGPCQPTPLARLIFVERGTHQVGFVVDEEIGMRYVMPIGDWTEGDVITGEAALDGRRARVINGDVLIARLVQEVEGTYGGESGDWR
jgi:CheW-like domain